MTDDDSNKYRPDCNPVEWTAHTIDNPSGKIKVVAQTWFAAREKACAVLGIEPEQLILFPVDNIKNNQKPTTTNCPSCSPVKSRKTASCK